MVPAAVILIAVIAVGGFLAIRSLGGNHTPSMATEPPASISTIPTDPIDPIDYEQEYADVPDHLRDHVMLYAEALYENWPQEKWERIGLSLELYQVKDHVDCGFVLKDLDSDGFEDLLIYGGKQLYQILVVNFWPVDTAMGQPAHTLWCLTREENESRMFLCEDNVIMHTYVLNDGDEYIDYCRLGKNSSGLSCLETIETVFAIDGTEWFAGPNYKDAVPITNYDAENIRSGYKHEEVEPRLFPRKKVHVVNYEQEFADVDERYRPLLVNYARALSENWSQDQWLEAELSPEMYQAKDRVIFGYILLDMDGNGVDELMIFGGNYLYALYVLRDDQPSERLKWTIHNNAERGGIQLCDNYILKVPQADSNGNTHVSFYRLGKDGLGAVDLVMVDTAFQTPEGQWYAGPNEKDSVPVTEGEAIRMIAGYVVQKVDVQLFLKYYE